MVKYNNAGMIPTLNKPKPDQISDEVKAKQDKKPSPKLPYERFLDSAVGLFPAPLRRPIGNIVIPIVILLGIQAFGRRYL